MAKGLVQRLFRIFTGALLGYLWGWIWGWSLFDPNSDIWALAAGLGAIAGLVIGFFPVKEPYAAIAVCATLGLYSGWIIRTLIFGDTPGGWGVAIMAGGVLLGGILGRHFGRSAGSVLLPSLAGVLVFGFFGGFFLNIILLDGLPGWFPTRSIPNQAPAVIFCGIAGGIGTALWSARSNQRKG